MVHGTLNYNVIMLYSCKAHLRYFKTNKELFIEFQSYLLGEAISK